MKLYFGILALSLLLGLAVFAAAPEEATAGGCGFLCPVVECCNGQGSCDSGYQEYGVCMYWSGPCTSVCDFHFSGCIVEHLCP
jgi:hypothetical protein